MLLTNAKVIKGLGVLQEASKWGAINIYSNEERVVATINDNYVFTFLDEDNQVDLLFKKNPDTADLMEETERMISLTSNHAILKGYDNVDKFIQDERNEDTEDYYISRNYKIVNDKIVCFVKIELGEIDDDDDSEDKITFEFNYEVANQCWIAKNLLRELDKDLLKYLVK